MNKKKIVATIGGIVIAGAVLGACGGTTTSTPAKPQGPSYSQWKSGFSPVWSQVQADWNSTSAALGNNDSAGANSGFAALGQDAAKIAQYENSPDPVLNSDIQSLSNDLQNVATDGVTALSTLSNADMNTFGTAVQAFKSDEQAVLNDLTTDNSSLT